mmetsp:Transcript_12307/g.19388  ORF Transcript_12307/g.19388 Transcript_12307/m.19388 type:complete len:100 (-) Transcript_12307:743-1042(-)
MLSAVTEMVASGFGTGNRRRSTGRLRPTMAFASELSGTPLSPLRLLHVDGMALSSFGIKGHGADPSLSSKLQTKRPEGLSGFGVGRWGLGLRVYWHQQL